MRHVFVVIGLFAAGACTLEKILPEGTTTEIDSVGGTALSADGKLELEVPAGALAERTAITIHTDRNTHLSDLVSALYRLDPDGLTFDVPVTIRLAVAGVTPKGTLILANADGNGPVPVDASTYLRAQEELQGSLLHFSIYGAFDVTAECVPGPGGDAQCAGDYGACSSCSAASGAWVCEPLSCGTSCDDGVRNGNETGIDCGGECSPCVCTATCTVHADCSVGSYCVAGADGCTTCELELEGCPENQRGSVDEPCTCRSHADCESSSYCAPPEGTPMCGVCWGNGTCGSDTECDTGYVCDTQTLPTQCRTCDSSPTCVSACTSNDQCLTGQTCDPDGRCRATACASGSDCPTYFGCAQLACRGCYDQCARISCTADSECAGGVCVNGFCYDSAGMCEVPAP